MGYNAYDSALDDPWSAVGAWTVDGQETLATTQLHHRMDGFDFVREVTPTIRALPQAETAAEPLSAIALSAAAWGMVIDLDLCIGCNACVAACKAENNVPVVGKDQVDDAAARCTGCGSIAITPATSTTRAAFPAGALHALREGAVRDGLPGPRHRAQARRPQPDGLQPLHRHAHLLELLPLQGAPLQLVRLSPPADSPMQAAHNPDVTVRSRGVMEKCTYCTQRIEAAHVDADKENRAAARRRCRDRLPAAPVRPGDRFRRPQRSEFDVSRSAGAAAGTTPAGRTRHPAAHHLSGALERRTGGRGSA